MNKLVLCALVCLLAYVSAAGQTIKINEILSSNSSIITDEDGDYEDWIELHNQTDTTISLLGFGLTDNAAQPFKWVFPDISIPADGYMLIWCSDKNRTNPELPLHTNFKISADGETIVLTSAASQTIDTMPAVSLLANISYGIMPFDGLPAYYQEPTPGAGNLTVPLSGIMAPVTFSATSGFYTDGFQLTLSHPDPLAVIFYTVDGSEPNPDDILGKTYNYKNQYPELTTNEVGELLSKSVITLPYVLPIAVADRSADPDKLSNISTTMSFQPHYFPQQPVFKGTVVKARAYKVGAVASAVKTANYFISPEGGGRFSLPFISISTDESGLFEYNDGIHVAGKDFDDWREANPGQGSIFYADANYKRSGEAAEITGNMSYMVGGSEAFNQDVRIRVHGGFSRNYPNKTLRIYADDRFDYPFFPGYALQHFETILLRNSGNDGMQTYFRDAMIQKINGHLNVGAQAYQPAVVAINGEYWGLLNIRERYDRYYFDNHYGIADGDLDFLENHGAIIQEGDNLDYVEMVAYITANGLSDDANYAYIQTRMDTANFIDYYIANIYAANHDWPHNNMVFWRKRAAFSPNASFGQDGRWRWSLKDTDFGFGGNEAPLGYQMDMMAFTTSIGGDEGTNPEWSTYFFRKMLENQTFTNQFINRFADLMNTAYLPDRVNGIIEEMKLGIDNEIEEHWQRWANTSSVLGWLDKIQHMSDFATYRTGFQRDHIRTKFNISHNVNATLDCAANEGFIKINTIDIKPSTPGVAEQPYPWTGVYFSGIPITVKATALPGHIFSHWSGASESTVAEITFTPDADFNLTAHFTPTGNPETRVPIYFWMIDNTIANDIPLLGVDASYEAVGQAALEFRSALEGYPFTAAHPNWRKASLERRNSPTEINYTPEANNNEPFADSDMRGLQVKQPFQDNNRENILIFHLPTVGFKDIEVAFAAKNENAADALVVDYSVAETPEWIQLATLPLSSSYQLYAADFSPLPDVNQNANFKVRVRFSGTNMTADNGDRVTFNNVSVTGIAEDLAVPGVATLRLITHPNPVTEKLILTNNTETLLFNVYALDGRLVNSGTAVSEIDMAFLEAGIYLLQFVSGDWTETRKVIKR